MRSVRDASFHFSGASPGLQVAMSLISVIHMEMLAGGGKERKGRKGREGARGGGTAETFLSEGKGRDERGVRGRVRLEGGSERG